jgi:hypothetical protein
MWHNGLEEVLMRAPLVKRTGLIDGRFAHWIDQGTTVPRTPPLGGTLRLRRKEVAEDCILHRFGEAPDDET